MDIDVKWRRQRKRPRTVFWIISIMALGFVLLLLVSSFGSKPVRSQSIADIGHVVLFMQVWHFGLVSPLDVTDQC
jgi:hypothetical protein